MSLSFKTQDRIEKGLAEDIMNIYANTLRFKWSSEALNNAYLLNILKNPNYKRLPRYSQSFLEGVRYVMDKQLWKELVYSYDIEGTRLALTDARYRKIPPNVITNKYLHTGAWVYKEDVNSIFYPGVEKP